MSRENNMQDLIVKLNCFGDDRGNLVPVEAMKTLPFEIKRVYYLFDLKTDFPRGFHAHKQLKQFAICLRGSCDFVMDDGREKCTYSLSNPREGILIDKMIWHEMHNFSNDCLLTVFASDYYEESDYIRDYSDFQKQVRK